MDVSTHRRYDLKRRCREAQYAKERVRLDDFDLVVEATGEAMGVVGDSSIGPRALADISTMIRMYPRSHGVVRAIGAAGVPPHQPALGADDVAPPTPLQTPTPDMHRHHHRRRRRGRLLQHSWSRSLAGMVDGAVLVQTLLPRHESHSNSDILNQHDDNNNNNNLNRNNINTTDDEGAEADAYLDLVTSGMFAHLHAAAMRARYAHEGPREAVGALLEFNDAVHAALVEELGARAWKLDPAWTHPVAPALCLALEPSPGPAAVAQRQWAWCRLRSVWSFLCGVGRVAARRTFWRNALIRGGFTWGAAACLLRVLARTPGVVRRELVGQAVRDEMRRRRWSSVTATATTAATVAVRQRDPWWARQGDLSTTFDLVRILLSMALMMCQTVLPQVALGAWSQLLETTVAAALRCCEGVVAENVVLAAMAAGSLIAGLRRGRGRIGPRAVLEFVVSTFVFRAGEKVVGEDMYARLPMLLYLSPVAMAGVVLRMS